MKRLFGILPVAMAALSMMISCSGGDGGYRAPIFKQEARLDFEILGDEFFGSPSNIVATDNYLLVSGYTRNGGPTFFVFDKNGNPVRSGINSGRGPGETISGYINMFVDDDTVQYNDVQTGWRLAFSLEEFLKDGTLEIQMEALDLPGWCTYAMRTPKGDEIRLISRSGKKDLDMPQRTIQLESEGATYEYTEPAIEDREIAFFASLQRSIVYSPGPEWLSAVCRVSFLKFSIWKEVSKERLSNVSCRRQSHSKTDHTPKMMNMSSVEAIYAQLRNTFIQHMTGNVPPKNSGRQE